MAVRNLFSLKLHVHYEGKRGKKNQHSVTGYILGCYSAAVIASKPKLHEKVSSVDLAVTRDVLLLALLVCSGLLAPCGI